MTHQPAAHTAAGASTAATAPRCWLDAVLLFVASLAICTPSTIAFGVHQIRAALRRLIGERLGGVADDRPGAVPPEKPARAPCCSGILMTRDERQTASGPIAAARWRDLGLSRPALVARLPTLG